MPKIERMATGPARARVGLPVVADGSRRWPLLLRLPDSPASSGTCNNGCQPCLTHPADGAGTAETIDVRGRHVVIRHDEPTLRRDLVLRIRDLSRRGPASIAVLTNARMLAYAELARELVRAGAGRFIVKLFGVDAAAHDAHTRVPGSFEQALLGVANARAAGAETTIAFPLSVHGPRPHEEGAALARRLTGLDPVEMPEPEVVTHGGEFRWDLIELRGQLTHPFWVRSFFPMAHINTGPVCNLRCTYCNVRGGDDQRLFDSAYVEAMIDDAARRLVIERSGAGVPTVDFIGGEPTLHPDLPRFLARARAKGFPQITICTNGVLLLREGYLDRLVSAGLTGVRFSLHDHRPEVANALADAGDLGARYVDVARVLLSRSDLRPHIYRILLAETLDALPEYVRFLADNNRTGRPIELVLGLPSMRGRLFDHPELYPPLAGLREKVRSAVELAESLGIEALLHHAPACLYAAEPERVACLHVTTQQVDASTGAVRALSFEGDAQYGRACDSCTGKAEGCHGLPRAYFEADREAAEAWLLPIRYRAARGGA